MTDIDSFIQSKHVCMMMNEQSTDSVTMLVIFQVQTAAVCDCFLCLPNREETPPPQEVSVNGPV